MARKRDEGAKYWALVHDAERAIIKSAWQANGSISRTAEVLGVSPNFLSQKIKNLEITIERRPRVKPQAAIVTNVPLAVTPVLDRPLPAFLAASSPKLAKPLPAFLAAAAPILKDEDEDLEDADLEDDDEDDENEDELESELDDEDEFEDEDAEEDEDEDEDDVEEDEDETATHEVKRAKPPNGAPTLSVVRSDDDDIREN